MGDGKDWAKIVVITEKTLDRLRSVPYELRQAIETDNKKQALALLKELEQATCFLVKD